MRCVVYFNIAPRYVEHVPDIFGPYTLLIRAPVAFVPLPARRPDLPQKHHENKELQNMRNKSRNMPRPVKPPELGTKAAALEGCVDLIARMCGKPETVVRYWLDLYFQTRLAYAVEQEQRRREAQLMERIPQVFDAPKEETQETKEKVPAPEARADEPPAEARAEEEPVTEESVTPPPTGQMIVDICPAGESAGELAGFEPVTPRKQGAPRGNTNGADAAKFKREVLARLMKMRGDGLTLERIVRESDGSLTDDIILNILQARKIAICFYRKLNTALDRIEEGGITRT